MKLSCALLLTNGDVFLAVIPTGRTNYDLPKGIHDVGESITDTVVREIMEETGVDLRRYRNQLEYMGRYKYLDDKNIALFVLVLDKLPPTSSMKCKSMFNYRGIPTPEVEGFRYISFDKLSGFKPQMVKIIEDVREKIEIQPLYHRINISKHRVF